MTQPMNSFGSKPTSVPPRVPLPRANAFGGTQQPIRPYRDPRKFWVLIVGTLLVGGYLFVAVYRGLARGVYLVNGLDKEYSVSIAGRTYTLPPLSHTKVDVSEGELAVTVNDESLGFPVQRCTIKTPFLQRPYLNRMFVINPDRAALVYQEESLYSRNAVNGDAAKPECHAGELLTEFKGVDYKFDEFPKTISVDSKSSADIRKTRVGQYTAGTAVSRFQVVAAQTGDDGMQAYVRAYAAAHPDDLSFMRLMSVVVKAEESLSVLRSKLTLRPVLIEAHRSYQTVVETAEPQHDLAAEYRGFLSKEPDNTALMYLLARTVSDRAEARKLFHQAAEGKPAVPHAYNALAYDAVAAAQFSEALEFAHKAMAQSPQSDEFKYHEKEALMGLDRWETLLANLQRDQLGKEQDESAALEQIEVLTVLGRTAAVQNVVQGIAVNLTTANSAAANEEITHFKARADATVAYVKGDTAALDTAVKQLPTEELTSHFVAAVAANRLEEAVSLLGSFKRPAAAQHLAIFLAASGTPGKEQIATAQLKAAGDLLARSGRDERQISRWLLTATAPAPEEVCQAAATPELKRVVLTAMGVRFPKDRARYFAAAAPLNFDRAFPYWTVKKYLDASTPVAQ